MKTLANGSQRFVAFLIDSIIMGFVVYLLSLLLCVIFQVKEPVLEPFDSDVKPVLIEIVNDKLKTNNINSITISADSMDEEIAVYVNLVTDSDVKNKCSSLDDDLARRVINSVSDAKAYASETTRYSLVSTILSYISYLIVIILYYDVLGYYWSKQTVGRMLMKIKLVNMDGDSPSMGALIVRDVVGFGLYNLLNVCCFIALIINAIYIIKSHISVGDRLSSTRMVRYDEAALTQEKENDYNSYNNSNYFYENNQSNNDEEIKDAEIVDDENKSDIDNSEDHE